MERPSHLHESMFVRLLICSEKQTLFQKIKLLKGRELLEADDLKGQMFMGKLYLKANAVSYRLLFDSYGFYFVAEVIDYTHIVRVHHVKKRS